MIQTQALNYILESKDSSFITSNSLTKDYFSEYVSEFEFIKSHIELYNNVPDIETFLNQFPDFDYIKVNENPEYLLSGFQEDRNKRYLAEVFNKIRNLLMEGKTDEALKLYSSSQTQNFNSISLKAVDIYSDISRYESYATKSTDFSKFYVTTGFREIDKVLGGWDRLEELGVIFARSNQGKSWCLLKCAVAAAKQGLRVGVYSGEMTATKVAYIAKKYCVKNPNTDVSIRIILVFLFTLYSLFTINKFKYKNAVVKNVSIIYILWNIIVEIPPMLNP